MSEGAKGGGSHTPATQDVQDLPDPDDQQTIPDQDTFAREDLGWDDVNERDLADLEMVGQPLNRAAAPDREEPAVEGGVQLPKDYTIGGPIWEFLCDHYKNNIREVYQGRPSSLDFMQTIHDSNDPVQDRETMAVRFAGYFLQGTNQGVVAVFGGVARRLVFVGPHPCREQRDFTSDIDVAMTNLEQCWVVAKLLHEEATNRGLSVTQEPALRHCPKRVQFSVNRFNWPSPLTIELTETATPFRQRGEYSDSMWEDNRGAPHTASLFQFQPILDAQPTDDTLKRLTALRPCQEPQHVPTMLEALAAGKNQVLHQRGSELMRHGGKYNARWGLANFSKDDSSIYYRQLVAARRAAGTDEADAHTADEAARRLIVGRTQPFLSDPCARRLLPHILCHPAFKTIVQLSQQIEDTISKATSENTNLNAEQQQQQDIIQRRKLLLSKVDPRARWEAKAGPLVYAFGWERSPDTILAILNKPRRGADGAHVEKWKNKIRNAAVHLLTNPSPSDTQTLLSIPYVGETVNHSAAGREVTHVSGEVGTTGLAGPVRVLFGPPTVKRVLMTYDDLKEVHAEAAKVARAVKESTCSTLRDGYVEDLCVSFVRLVTEGVVMELLSSTARDGGLNICASGRGGGSLSIRLYRIMVEVEFIVTTSGLVRDQTLLRDVPAHDRNMDHYLGENYDAVEMAELFAEELRPNLYVYELRYKAWGAKGMLWRDFEDMDRYFKSFVESVYTAEELDSLTLGRIQSDLGRFAASANQKRMINQTKTKLIELLDEKWKLTPVEVDTALGHLTDTDLLTLGHTLVAKSRSGGTLNVNSVGALAMIELSGDVLLSRAGAVYHHGLEDKRPKFRSTVLSRLARGDKRHTIDIETARQLRIIKPIFLYAHLSGEGVVTVEVWHWYANSAFAQGESPDLAWDRQGSFKVDLKGIRPQDTQGAAHLLQSWAKMSGGVAPSLWTRLTCLASYDAPLQASEEEKTDEQTRKGTSKSEEDEEEWDQSPWSFHGGKTYFNGEEVGTDFEDTAPFASVRN